MGKKKGKEKQPTVDVPPGHDDEPDLKERATSFNRELQRICGKYEIVLLATPFVAPDGTIAGQVQIKSERKWRKEMEEAKRMRERLTGQVPQKVAEA